MKMKISFGVIVLIGLGVLYWLYALPSVPKKEIDFSQESIERGEYLVHVSGCISCHIDQSGDSEALIGGLDFPTDFGTFYAANITPDEETGIGGWKAKDFFLALRHGRTASRGAYVSAFPYRGYAAMSDQEVLDIAAYIMSQPAVAAEVPEHETPAWLITGLAMPAWNKMADFMEGDLPEFDETNSQLVRGAYLARELGHCGECHTPRNGIGIADQGSEFGGGELFGKKYPAIDAEALATWSKDDFEYLLTLGMLPSGDFVGGHMGHVVDYNTSPMTDEDLKAMTAFFMRHLDQ